MNELAKFSTGAIPAIPERKRVNAVLGLVTKALVLAGKNMNGDDLAILVREADKLVATKYKFHSLADIEEALVSGARGDYGDYFSINLKEINFWIGEYTRRKQANERKKVEGQSLPEMANTIVRGVNAWSRFREALEKIEDDEKKESIKSEMMLKSKANGGLTAREIDEFTAKIKKNERI